MSYIFFRIEVPDAANAREWAKRMWDTYGFDYDLEKSGHEWLRAWALDSEEALKVALREDAIPFETFKVDDLDAFLGC